MRVIRINTTAYNEEDFFLLTTLSDEMISFVIKPLIDAERQGIDHYDNEDLWRALTYEYPSEKITMFHNFDTIQI